MTILIALFGLMLAAACLWGIITPRHMIDTIIRFWNKPSGLWLAIGIRVVMGVLFILAAPQTRFPDFFVIFGYLLLIAAAIIPLVGKERLTRVIMWFTNIPMGAVRAWLLMGLAFAVFIVYGVM